MVLVVCRVHWCAVDLVRRLAFSLFMAASVLALLSPRLARAEYEYTPKTQGSPPVAPVNVTMYRAGYGGLYGQYSTDKASACSSASYAVTQAYSGFYLTGVVGGTDNLQCQWGRISPAGTGFGNPTVWITVSQQPSCSPGYQLDNGQCYPLVCPTDNVRPWESDPQNGSQCRRLLECPWPQKLVGTSCTCSSGRLVQFQDGAGGFGLGQTVSAVTHLSGNQLASRPETICLVDSGGSAGCSVQVEASTFDGSQTHHWGDIFTGSTCTGGGAGGASTPGDQPCPAGQVRGTVNGLSICVRAGETITSKPPKTETKTVTNPDGSTTTTETTTSETVVCEAGGCTTTVTTSVTITQRDSQGNVTGSETSSSVGEREGGDEGGSSFSGQCGSFACDGDAVQCAIALEQYRRNCEFWESKGITREAAETEFDETRQFDRSQLNADPVEFGTGIASSTFLSGGCVQDQQFQIWGGQTFIIPFASLCPYLAAAGNAFLAVCGLIAFAVVRRGIEA